MNNLEYKLTNLEFVGYVWRASFDCSTLEEFLTWPSNLPIDGKCFDKHSYVIQNKTAYYERSAEITISNNQTGGNFIIINHPDEIVGNQTYSTNISVTDVVSSGNEKF